MTDFDYDRQHESRKDTRRREAEERQEAYESAIRAEAGRINLEEDGPEDELFAQAKRNVDALQRVIWMERKESGK